MKRHLRGMTLTEMAIVLGAMGLISGAVWAIVGTVWDGYRFRKMNQQVQTVAQALQDYYGNIGGIYQPGTKTAYADDTSLTAIIDADARRLIPIDMRSNKNVAGSEINHALATVAGGSFRVESRNSGARFRVRLLGLKQDACTRFLMEYPANVAEMGVVHMGAIGAGTNEVDIDANNPVDATPTSAVEVPLPISTATTWCSKETDNEVFLDFKVRK